MRSILLLGFLAFRASAADVETWNAAEAEVLVGERVNLTLQAHFRSRYNLGEFYQARFGPIVKVRLTPRLVGIGGYYFRDSENTRLVWRSSHRPFGGVEAPIYDGKVKISTRIIAERFIHDTVPNYWRFREWVRVSGRGKVAPYGLLEAFQTPRGAAFLRAQGGVQWRMHRRTSLELGCLHDSSHKWYGPNRTAALTTLRFHLSAD